MIVKRSFHPFRVVTYIWKDLLLSLFISTSLYFLNLQLSQPFYLPFSISAILGSALAIFIAFRNNTAYSRWWEARTAWGSIINSSRIYARLIITFSESHSNTPNYNATRTWEYIKKMIYMQIAWVYALKIHLRKESNWTILQNYLEEEDYKNLINKENKPNYIQYLQGKNVYDGLKEGILLGFDTFQIEAQLANFANMQGTCERIKNTPLLRQYDYFTRVFLNVFIIILPFSLYMDFSKTNNSFLIIPISFIVSFVFAIIGKVGEVNEDPFENRITDVPMSSICNTIERDLKEVLGESPLPEKLENVDGILM